MLNLGNEKLPPQLEHVVCPPPYTLHPTPYTLHPTPYTLYLHPTPYTLQPSPHTLRPAPYTLHPTPYTLRPTPYTLHPTPYTLRGLSATLQTTDVLGAPSCCAKERPSGRHNFEGFAKDSRSILFEQGQPLITCYSRE